MEQTTVINEITIYNKAIETFRGGGEILAGNQAIVSKAVAAGKSIIAKVEANGGKLTAELDQLSNDYLVKIGQRKKQIEDARKPVTQMMDAIKKMFTSEEAKLDVTSAATVPFRVQQLRNGYAREQAELERKNREEAARKAAKERERVSLIAAIELALNKYFQDYLLNYKQQMHAGFNAITLDNFQEKQEKLMKLPCVYRHDHYTAFSVPAGLTRFYHSDEEVAEILSGITADRYTVFAPLFTQETEELKQQLIDRLPSKKAELEAISKSNEEERRRLEEEQKRREQEEQDRIKKEAEVAQRKAEQEIEMKKTEGETLALFDQEATLAESAEKPETREGFEITVLHPVGYVQLFQFWFENEGKNLGVDKLGNKKLDQMKTWCEAHAHKTGEVIDSKFLKYEPTYKAVNRKQK